MKFNRLSIVAAALAALTATASAQATDGLVDNPLYAAWASHKPGTTVTMDASPAPDSPLKRPGSTITYKLLEVTADKVEVERHTVSKFDQIQPVTSRLKIAARIAADRAGLPDADKGGRKVSAVSDGKGVVEVLGKKYEATTRTFTTESEASAGKTTSTTKVFLVPEIPGGIARIERTGDMGGKYHIVTTVTATKPVK